MKIGDILEEKGRQVHTVAPDASILDAIRLMAEDDIGSLMVVGEGHEIIGIVTERDCVRAMADDPARIASTPIESVTTREIVVAGPEDDLDYIIDAMKKARCRHIPVIEDDRLAGMISIRDVIRSQLEETTTELKFLTDYVRRG